MFLLNGRILASDIARDSLKEAMYVDPNTVDLPYGLVHKAMAFLAGYGIYVTVVINKLVGRMLDNYAAKLKVHGHPLVGPFNSYVYKRSQKFYGVAAVASIIRVAIKELCRIGILRSRWKTASA